MLSHPPLGANLRLGGAFAHPRLDVHSSKAAAHAFELFLLLSLLSEISSVFRASRRGQLCPLCLSSLGRKMPRRARDTACSGCTQLRSHASPLPQAARVPKEGELLEVEVAETEENGGGVSWKPAEVRSALHGRA